MKLLIVALAFVATAYAGSYNILNMEDIINKVNQAHTTWTAGHNFAPDTPVSYYKNLMGVKAMTNGRRLTMKSYSGTQIPEEFDARKQWPECPTISHLLDQGNCGSCWAVAGASAFSDRLCIASNGTFTTPLSVEELLSCCDECGDGCNGGYPASAWEYFVENGLSTGGDYDSKVGCLPYTIQPCEHHTTGKRPQCSALPESDTPECQRQCQNSQYKTDFRKDHHKAKSSYGFYSNEAVQEDILKYGSAEASFDVYADFVAYKSGVYQHVTGSYLGGHAVRVIGWGVEKGTPYWLVANSWNSDWGDNGTFKIIRGTDDCGFEDGIVAGVPA
ncbi:Hypothetical protein NTJ_07046 [Nesidiocoris tenuis]|uniref:Peptidase C1A papain C-terminal domain-containing protein n=1 Tax=Nesidiocoris tenuis TaxID=355587 RepID=A0ABN7AUV2_9HEMI|nr:Hypothetical protein NTJ_07046 [Nesidiocoris tenuis]